MMNAEMVIRPGFRVAGIATMSTGSRIPAALANRVYQPYPFVLNNLSITSLSHLADPNQLVKYSENVK